MYYIWPHKLIIYVHINEKVDDNRNLSVKKQLEQFKRNVSENVSKCKLLQQSLKHICHICAKIKRSKNV